MFRKGAIQDPEVVMIFNAASKWEADLAKSLLENAGIPAMLMDREDSGDYLRVLGFGSPFGVDVYVNKEYADRAAALLEETFSEMEDVSEEELAQLAMDTKVNGKQSRE